MVDVELHEVQPGDWADHVSRGLDPRQVTRVNGGSVWLQLGTGEMGPFPLTNYTYTREVEDGA